MKLTIKTLQNKQLPIEVASDSITVIELKKEIEKEHGFAHDTQTLICKGKKLEEQDKSLADYAIKDGDFIIIMIPKAKPVAKPDEKKEEKAVISPAVSIEGGA